MFKTIVLAIAFVLATVGFVTAADNVADAVKADALAPKVADKADATKPVEAPKAADKVADVAKPVDKVADVAKVTGIVAIAKAADGAVTVTVTITVPAAKDAKDKPAIVYSVVQDEVGKTLIKLAGETVTATGTVAEVKGVQTLTVKEVKAQEAKK